MKSVIAIIALFFTGFANRNNLVVADLGYNLIDQENLTDEDGANDATVLQSSVTNVSSAS